jgi:hypothetical protein
LKGQVRRLGQGVIESLQWTKGLRYGDATNARGELEQDLIWTITE